MRKVSFVKVSVCLEEFYTTKSLTRHWLCKSVSVVTLRDGCHNNVNAYIPPPSCGPPLPAVHFFTLSQLNGLTKHFDLNHF